MSRFSSFVLCCLVVVATCGDVRPAAASDYAKQIKPLLAARCYSCHGALKQEGDLRLDTAAAIRRGGASGTAIDAKQPDASVLLKRITAEVEERMPPEGEGSPFKPEEVALLREWIAAGASGPADEQPESDPRSHWAFRVPERPKVPRVKNSAWVRNPIDAFILAKLEERGISPQPTAEPAVLLRRVYLDLTGLPPTLEEIEAFERDPSEKAFQACVDRLLASPQYGERWGRHWMDVWRYSDWWGLGADVRNSQKHIWHWRDWIVESLNDDVGYDEMLRQMLAADELYPEDMNKLRATGYLVRSYFKFNRNSWLEQVVEHTSKGMLGLTMNCSRCHDHKYDPFAQRDFYRFRAFFEPYQVRTDQLPGEADLEKNGLPRAFDAHPDAPTYRYLRGDETKPVKDEPLTPALPTLLAPRSVEIESVSLPPAAYQPGLRNWVLGDQLALAEKKIATAKEAVTAAEKKRDEAKEDARADLEVEVEIAQGLLAAAEDELPTLKLRGAADWAKIEKSTDEAAEAARAAATAERNLALNRAQLSVKQAELDVRRAKTPATPADDKPKSEAEQTAAKTAADKKIAAAEKKLKDARDNLTKAETAAKSNDGKYSPLAGSLKAFESSVETDAERRRPYPATTTGRRTALAQLLVDRGNPLTARVAVNHIWLRHMGKPLVPTVFDFGRKGTPPTHPELLDWLAAEFRDGSKPTKKSAAAGSSAAAWSMKHLHRLIVTSNTYRLNSATAGNEQATKNDADNIYYWRMNPVRTEAQVVRDSLLQLAGELDLQRGGPSIDPATNPFSKRRSLYFIHSHNEHHRFLAMFDDADVLDCYRREQSIVPQQALALVNAKQSLEAAEKIAARIGQRPEAQTDEGFIRVAYKTILASVPNAAEETACQEALADWRKLTKETKGVDRESRARSNLVHALLNHNDFVTVK